MTKLINIGYAITKTIIRLVIKPTQFTVLQRLSIAELQINRSNNLA